MARRRGGVMERPSDVETECGGDGVKERGIIRGGDVEGETKREREGDWVWG